jgi:hypothetical protein
MKLNNKRTCKDLSVAMNVCTLKVEPWVITISSRPGSDNKVRADRAPSHRSKDNIVLYTNTPFKFQRSMKYWDQKYLLIKINPLTGAMLVSCIILSVSVLIVDRDFCDLERISSQAKQFN